MNIKKKRKREREREKEVVKRGKRDISVVFMKNKYRKTRGEKQWAPNIIKGGGMGKLKIGYFMNRFYIISKLYVDKLLINKHKKMDH